MSVLRNMHLSASNCPHREPWLGHVIIRAIGIVIALTATGCGVIGGIFGGLKADAVATSAEPPANVAVYLSVRDGSDPITDLSAANFKLLENGQPLSSKTTQLVLLDRDAVALHRVLLLVDVSKAESDGVRRELARGVASFVQSVRKRQAVTVMAFDGRAEPVLVADYPAGTTDKPEPLVFVEPRDASRNLNGAVMHGIKQLNARLMTAKKPIRVGTLVIFTAGPDLAARVTRAEAEEKIRTSPHHVVAVIVATEDQDVDLGEAAKDGLYRAPSLQMAGIGLDEAARGVNALEQQYYLLSYCSPARAGKRRLSIEVKRTTPRRQGAERHRGSGLRCFGFWPWLRSPAHAPLRQRHGSRTRRGSARRRAAHRAAETRQEGSPEASAGQEATAQR